MEDRIGELERQLESERCRADDEKRLREAAEESNRPLTLANYLDMSHELLSRVIEGVADPSSATPGQTTKPEGRLYPRQMIPWDDSKWY